MPRIPINYQNTIIYKIVCNDLNIKYTYVGHTTNFKERKRHHKVNCNNKNENDKHFKLKVYTTIRECGGWDNWSMVEIENFPCDSLNEATKRERYWYEELNANLNMICPQRSKKEYNEIYSKEKKQLSQKKYEEKNRDKINERQREFYINNKEKIALYHKEHYKNNKEYINNRNHIYNLQFYSNNRDREILRAKTYRELNIDKVREKQNLYRELNKDKINERHRERRKQLKLLKSSSIQKL